MKFIYQELMFTCSVQEFYLLKLFPEKTTNRFNIISYSTEERTHRNMRFYLGFIFIFK